MGPFKLSPAYKDYIWGGVKLKERYGKQTELGIVAESWELSAHEDGSAVISHVAESADAAFIGMPFREFTEKYPVAAGTRAKGKDFPILIKLIDAKNDLSIQVHPDDEFAREHENSFGKTELWHILEADDGAFLYLGFNRDVEKSEVRSLIESGGIIGVLNRVPVKKGDTFMINAGTLHAINKGIVLAEIQQNSNLTYRVYDYDRLGPDGKPRALHIEKALAVMDTKKYEGRDGVLPVTCPYFTVGSHCLDGEYRYHGTDETFAAFLITEGALEISAENGALNAQKGDCVFVPAGKGTFNLTGQAEFLQTTY